MSDKLAAHLTAWLRRQLRESRARGFVIGLSGGVDSSVVAVLATRAAPGAALAALLPCYSDPRDERDARELADRLAVPAIRVELDQVFDRLTAPLAAEYVAHSPFRAFAAPDDDIRRRVPLSNVKPRLRMTALYFLANMANCLVVGTGNHSELAVGYFTKYGDGGVDLLPLGNLVKREVRALAATLEIPREVIEKPPSPGLWTGQTDEAEMGFSYDELDAYLLEGPDAVAPATALKIERLVRASEHKRDLPPMAPRLDQS